MPREPEVGGLLALMTMQHARRDARVDASGDLVLLPDQDRRGWRHDEIAAGLRVLARAANMTTKDGRFLVEAQIAAVHAIAERADDTDWRRIASLYHRLEALTGSPVVRVNRAIAVAEVAGPAAGLRLLDGLDAALPRFAGLWLARADLLARLGQTGPALDACDRAIVRTASAPQRRALECRRAGLWDQIASPGKGTLGGT